MISRAIYCLLMIAYTVPAICQECVASDSTDNIRVLIMKQPAINESVRSSEPTRLFMEIRQKSDNKLITEANISHAVYGGQLWSERSLRVIPQRNNTTIIAFQTSFGGDGESTSNMFILYQSAHLKLSRLYYDQLNDVVILPDPVKIKEIQGRRIISLCDVCDSDDATDSTMLFIIPVSLKLEGTQVREICALSQREKRLLIDRFIRVKNEEIEIQREYSNEQLKDYTRFADTTERTLRQLLSRK